MSILNLSNYKSNRYNPHYLKLLPVASRERPPQAKEFEDIQDIIINPINNYTKNNFNEYEMDFLTLKTNFSDKTTIQLTIQNKIKETFITKKSKKGRLKRSVKRMNQTIYKANVGFSKLQYQAKPNVAFTEKKEKYWLTSQTDTISEENLTEDILNAKDLIQYNSKHLWSEIAKTYAKMNVIK